MPADATTRMLAAREEVIARLKKSAEIHQLDEAQLVAVSVHAVAAAHVEATGYTKREVGEAMLVAVKRYIKESQG
jgi:hypothetical protein